MSGEHSPKIVFVVPSAYLLGGVQVWLDYLLKGLNQHGFKCVCLAVDGQFHNAEHYFARYPFDHQIRVANPLGTHWGRVHSLTRALHKAQPDMVVVVNIPDAYTATHKVRQSSGRNIKLVAAIHALEPDYFADVIHQAKIIDAVLVTNQLTATAVVEFCKIERERVYYAPYGVEVGVQRDHKVNESKPLKILYSGRIEDDQKRCSDLVDIAVELNKIGVDFELKIAGDGPLKADLTVTFAQSTVANRVEFLGMVDRGVLLNEVIPTCDVLLITSAWETGPIVAWEAMAAGLPVVSSRYIGLREENALLHQSNCLLFDVNDAPGAAKQLARLHDPSLVSSIVNSAHRLIRERYTQQASVACAAKVFTQILAAPPVSSRYKLVWTKYQKHGLPEKLFGARFGHYIRGLINRPAQSFSAGDEWPHTLGLNKMSVSAFTAKLLALKSQAGDPVE